MDESEQKPLTLTEMIESLIDNWLYLDCGTYEYFWDSTFREIVDLIKARQKRHEDDVKSQTLMNYHLAVNIVSFLGCSLGGKPIPTFNELYPDISIQKEINPELQAIKFKEEFKQFAAGFNKQHAAK